MWSPAFFPIVLVAAPDTAAPDEQSWRFDVPRQAGNMQLLVVSNGSVTQ